jgi:hypothetical protein
VRKDGRSRQGFALRDDKGAHLLSWRGPCKCGARPTRVGVIAVVEDLMARMHEPAGSGTSGTRGSSSTSSAAVPSVRTTCAARFATLLHERGLLHALGYLNERTRYRFTGLYRVDPPMLRNVGLFDRENPDIDVSGAVTKLDETYCSITCATAKPFTTMDAPRDERLVAHAARDSILCYAGVPIRFEGGRPWGSLCHFDLRPRLRSADELCALETVAPVVAGWLRSNPESRSLPARA